MKTIFGTKISGLVLASILLFMFGGLWYGFIFADQWSKLSNITPEQAEAMHEQNNTMMYVLGFMITVAQVLGLSWVFEKFNIHTRLACKKTAAMIALFFGFPIMAYNTLYSVDASAALLAIDFGHILLGYVMVAGILSFFRAPPPAP